MSECPHMEYCGCVTHCEPGERAQLDEYNLDGTPRNWISVKESLPEPSKRFSARSEKVWLRFKHCKSCECKPKIACIWFLSIGSEGITHWYRLATPRGGE